MEEEEYLISPKRPTLVVTLGAIFGATSLQGDTIVSHDVLALIELFASRGFYILVDCRETLNVSMELLNSNGVIYNGLMYDTHSGYVHDLERYIERLTAHCGLDAVHSIIDEDVMRLSYAEENGISAFQVMGGSIIYQSCRGKMEGKVPVYGDAFSAEGSLNVLY